MKHLLMTAAAATVVLGCASVRAADHTHRAGRHQGRD